VDSAEIRAWLDSHVNLELLVGVPSDSTRRVAPQPLSRMQRLVELLGSPQLEYPAIHITGTNGKTSTARMITALLVNAGLSVGTDTSPYLERFNERISWNLEPIPDDDLDRILAGIADVELLLDDRPTYFEIVNAAALTWFADIAVEVAVIEVGLGGTWDSTNVVDGEIAVITNIELDHVEYLGPTREGIAEEKAGIVKPGATLVLGETDPALLPIFTAHRPLRVAQRNIDFGVRVNQVAHGGRLIDVFTPYASYPDVFLSLHGAHQADNAAVALTAAEAFVDRPLGADVVMGTFAAIDSPGRLEVVRHEPLVIVDGTKNVAGARAVCAALAEEFPRAARTWVVGVLIQKDAREMLEALGVSAGDSIVCCRPDIPRARDPEEVAAAAREIGIPADHVHVVSDVAAAVDAAIELAAPAGQVVVAGSLYVAGPARAHLVR
jgi:dihydrofolate synthase/folylpolyglutamate synthase